AGNANCATPNGREVAIATAAAAAQQLGVPGHEVLVASTGVIGVPLDAARLTAAIPGAIKMLSPSGFPSAAAAILTTDTRPQTAPVPCGKASVLGFAKGAGMIYPRMKPHATPHATMLAFIVTDAAVSPAKLRKLTAPAVERTFNRISVDGDTS